MRSERHLLRCAGVLTDDTGNTDDTETTLLHGEITSQSLAAFYRAYNGIGFGFSEPICRRALKLELELAGLPVRSEVPIEVCYRGAPVGMYRIDLLVNDTVVLEIKATKALDDGDERQLLNYLKASHYEVGLLLNFGPKPEFRRRLYTNDRK